MSKDQWIADVERILSDYGSEIIEHETAVGRLIDMGLDLHEAEKMLLEVIS